jgi:outer membrane protein OmpA-like peptidoglycan-associated protein
MTSVRASLLSGAALSLLLAAGTAGAAEGSSGPLLLAQATTDGTAQTQTDPDNPVTIAQKEVDDARTALRQAMATGGDVRGARRALQAALKDLNEVRTAAGLGAVTEPPAEPSSTQDAPGRAPPPETSVAVPTTPPEEIPTLPEEPAPQPDIDTPPVPPAADNPTIATPDNPPAETIPPPPPTTQQTPPPPTELPTLATPATPTIEKLPEPPPPAPSPEVTTTERSPSAPTPGVAEPVPPAPVLAPKAGKEEEKPGFFKRLFSRDKQDQEETAAVPPASETVPAAPKKDEPVLPIFKELPPLAGPKVVTIAPGDASVVKQEDEGRIIVKEGGKLTVKHDDNDRFRRKGEQVTVEPGNAGTTVTTVRRPGGVVIVTVRDARGDILQRYRTTSDGEIAMLIGDRDKNGRVRQGKAPARGDRDFDFYKTLPKLTVTLPPAEYIVPSQGASRSRIQEALIAPPVEAIERPYSLDEIRGSERLRAKLRRIDIDTVNFEFGAATVGEDQVPNLQAIGNALAAIIADNPNEIFLVEGHTDAVGSDLSNLALSDRRAESIAEILTYYFNIPPENLVTQGYGEQYLKVPTAGPERQNRRASVRRVTPLLAGEM